MNKDQWVVLQLKSGAWEEDPVERVYGPYDLIETAEVVSGDLMLHGHSTQVMMLMCYWRVGSGVM